MRAREIELLLPEVVRRTVVPDSPMSAYLAVMEGMHAPAEDALKAFPDVLDPLATPERFVPMLAAWVDLKRLDETPAGRLDVERLRLLVAQAADLGRHRGTAAGLVRVLELATGVTGLALEEVGPFHARISVPDSGAALLDLLRELAEQEKPAHLLVDVELASGGAR